MSIARIILVFGTFLGTVAIILKGSAERDKVVSAIWNYKEFSDFGLQSSITDTVRSKIAKFEVSLARWAALDRETALFRIMTVSPYNAYAHG